VIRLQRAITISTSTVDALTRSRWDEPLQGMLKLHFDGLSATSLRRISPA